MNRDDSGISATDPAAPAAVSTDPATTPAEPFAEMDEPGKVSDVIDVVEHFETDSELAEYAIDRFNQANALTEQLSDRQYLRDRALHVRLQGMAATEILTSRALMRSAAAHERLAAVGERNERRLLETRAVDEESRKLHLENLRLQNRAFTGELERLSILASLAGNMAGTIQAAKLAGGLPSEEDVNGFMASFLEVTRNEAHAAASVAD